MRLIWRWVAVSAIAFVVSACLSSVSGAASAKGRTSIRHLSASETACFKDATTAARSFAMPKPTRLVEPISLQWNGTITLDPAPASGNAVVNPSSIWKTFAGTDVGSHSQLFLAYFTSTVPAILEPDGTLNPLSNHVLAWVLLTQHEPFDTAGVSVAGGPGAKVPPPTCTFVGQNLTAWNALTGAGLQGGGGIAPSNPSTIRPAVAPWRS
jgi:hypothetical protein